MRGVFKCSLLNLVLEIFNPRIVKTKLYCNLFSDKILFIFPFRERIEKLELDCKELEKINADLQSELTSFSEVCFY